MTAKMIRLKDCTIKVGSCDKCPMGGNDDVGYHFCPILNETSTQFLDLDYLRPYCPLEDWVEPANSSKISNSSTKEPELMICENAETCPRVKKYGNSVCGHSMPHKTQGDCGKGCLAVDEGEKFMGSKCIPYTKPAEPATIPEYPKIPDYPMTRVRLMDRPFPEEDLCEENGRADADMCDEICPNRKDLVTIRAGQRGGKTLQQKTKYWWERDGLHIVIAGGPEEIIKYSRRPPCPECIWCGPLGDRRLKEPIKPANKEPVQYCDPCQRTEPECGARMGPEEGAGSLAETRITVYSLMGHVQDLLLEKERNRSLHDQHEQDITDLAGKYHALVERLATLEEKAGMAKDIGDLTTRMDLLEMKVNKI